jgi:hypothetical protein
MSSPIPRRGTWFPRLPLLFFSLMFVLSYSAFGQLGSAQLQGTVTDPTGAVVPNANVTVKSVDTGITRQVTTNDSGDYRVVDLTPGTYEVSVTHAGFRRTIIRVEAVVGTTATGDIKLAVAAAGETVEVTEAAVGVDTEKTDVGNVVTKDMVGTIPVIGRRWDNYVMLTPGVAPDGTFGLISYRGISGLYNNNSVDGMDNNQAFFSEARGRTRAVYIYSQAAIQEFQVGLSNFNAEYGRAAGGLVNAVTKSGSNEIHGQAFYYIRDDLTSAADTIYADTIRSQIGNSTLPERRQQFGFAVGGPIKKDKLFWFLNYDQSVRRNDYLSNFTGFAWERLNAGGVPQCTASYSSDVPSAANCAATWDYINSLATVNPRKQFNNVAFGKMDWVINNKNNFSVSYNFQKWRSPSGIQTDPVVGGAASYNGFDGVRTDSVVAKLNTVLSPTLVNELRFQYAKDFEWETANGMGPGLGIYQAFNIGQPAYLPRAAYPDEKRYEWADTLSWSHGNHLIKAGLDINHITDNLINLYNGGGVYSYTYWGDLALDCAPTGSGCTPTATTASGGTVNTTGQHYYSYTQAFDLRADPFVSGSTISPGSMNFSSNNWNFFVQDTWKVHRDVTLNLGLRYEYQQLPQPMTVSALYSGSVQDIKGNPGIPATQSFPQDKNNWGPRIGLAWDVLGKHTTTVRAGFGIMYGLTSNSAIAQALLNNGALSKTIVWYGKTGSSNPSTGAPQYPGCFLGAVNSANCTNNPLSGGSAQTPDISVFAPKFQRPMIEQVDFSIEHELARNLVVSATYNFSGGHFLPIFRDINLPDALQEMYINLPTALMYGDQVLAAPGVYGPYPFWCQAGASYSCPTTSVRPNSTIRKEIEAESVANSAYHGLILAVRKRMSRGLMINAHFTWSKAIDNGQNSTTFFSQYTTFYDPTNPKFDRALSDFNVPKRFVLSYVWQPDRMFHFSEGPARTILGDWLLSGSFAANAGRPLTLSTSGSFSVRALDTSTINGSGGEQVVPFIGRNTFQAPGYADFDMRLQRRFRIGEGKAFAVMAEAFNLFNRTNYTRFDTAAFRMASGTFGSTVTTCGGQTITAGNRCIILQPLSSTIGNPLDANGYGRATSVNSVYGNMREFQFGAKFTF